MIRRVIAVLAFTVLPGCFLIYPKAGPPPGAITAATLSAAHSRWPDATPESLEQGRQTFLEHCNDCHDYPELSRHSDEKWPKILNRMGRKADLSADETDRVLKFVLAYRGEHAAQ